MEKNELRSIIESLLFMSTEPLTVSEIKKIIDNVKRSAVEGKPVAEAESFPDGEAVVQQGALPAEGPQLTPEIDPLAQLEQMKSRMEGEISKGEIKDCLLEMVQEYQKTPGRGFELVEVAKGFQYRTPPQATPFVKAIAK